MQAKLHKSPLSEANSLVTQTLGIYFSHQNLLKIVFLDILQQNFKAHHISCWKSDPQSDPSLPSTKETPDDA